MWTRKQEGDSACRFPGLAVGSTANNAQHAVEAKTTSITNIFLRLYVPDSSTNMVMYKVECLGMIR